MKAFAEIESPPNADEDRVQGVGQAYDQGDDNRRHERNEQDFEGATEKCHTRSVTRNG